MTAGVSGVLSLHMPMAQVIRLSKKSADGWPNNKRFGINKKLKKTKAGLWDIKEQNIYIFFG